MFYNLPKYFKSNMDSLFIIIKYALNSNKSLVNNTIN